MANPSGKAVSAPVRIRLLSLVYEALLLTALLMAATAAFVAVAGEAREQPLRTVLQAYLLAVAGTYFVWSWTGGRRTLPMRTWRLRLVDTNGNPPSLRTALVRFLAAAATWPLGALPLWWAMFDRERLFLHDRLAGTCLTRDTAPPSGTDGVEP
jgi:uncharacterized RDD family membrane protein YckC